MLDGPDGPEPDPSVVRDPSSGANQQEDEYIDEGETEVDLTEDEEASNAPKKGKKKKGKGGWEKVARQALARKEAQRLMARFGSLSTTRCQEELISFIRAMCHTDTPSSGSQGPLPSSSFQTHVLVSMTQELTTLVESSKILDFRRLVLLMQIALWVDWYVLM
jgi:hypothetical protein